MKKFSRFCLFLLAVDGAIGALRSGKTTAEGALVMLLQHRKKGATENVKQVAGYEEKNACPKSHAVKRARKVKRPPNDRWGQSECSDPKNRTARLGSEPWL
ncbi:hypothetical protein [Biformimicrobium ophioploci]|uniref:hypothetical protein n=1 Tax=Biformimicrobium ophioploci TaxID=3036711 RepID=UPI00255533E9|nr:hypothetical protein [Microbulbifer sp. NKW57]